MIDFDSLQPLPTRRQRDATDRERLAAASLAKKRAKHKGRNHWRNWERRKMASERRKAMAPINAKKASALSRYLSAARAYWRGERADHPVKP